MQLYLRCKKSECPDVHRTTINQLETCTNDICQWIPLNGLKWNDAKTELLQIQSKYGNKVSSIGINIGIDHIDHSASARNLGVLFDDTLSPYVSSICISAVFQLWQISRIRDFLTTDAMKKIVYSLVMSLLCAS